MKLAVSERVWSPAESASVRALLPHWGVSGVGVLRDRVEGEGVQAVRAAVRLGAGWREQDIVPLALLDPADGRHGTLWGEAAPSFYGRMVESLEIAAALEAPYVLLGAPSLRRVAPPAPMSRAHDLWLVALQGLGERAQSMGVEIAIKPIPATSGALFWRTTEEVFDTIQESEAPAVWPVLDAASLARDASPRSALAAYGGSAPFFTLGELFGGPPCVQRAPRHQLWARDLARLAALGRAPDWALWDADRDDGVRQAGPVIQRHIQSVRAVYGEALQVHPSGDGLPPGLR